MKVTNIGKEAAQAKEATEWWKTATPLEIVHFQLFEECLCMPMDDFRGALEEVLGEPLWDSAFMHPDSLRKRVLSL